MITQGDHTTAVNGSKQALDLIAGKYEVIEEIARSAAGTTYKVRHTLLDSVLRVTELAPDVSADQDRLGQLQRRLRSAMPLRHEHLMQVLDFGSEAGRHHVVEEMVEGETLAGILASGVALPAADALRIARQLADALAYANERGVVHGAVTAANVVVQRGSAVRAVLGGFALGALAVPSAALLACSAPERLSASASEVDGRSDVFALGLLLFEMIEGRSFFADMSETDIQQRLQGAEPLLPQFSSIAPSGIPAVIARAIRRLPEERQQSMAQVRTELDVCLHRFGTGAEAGDPPAKPKARAPLALAKAAPTAPTNGTPAAAAPVGAAPAPGAEGRKVIRVAFPEDDDFVDAPVAPTPAVPKRVVRSGGTTVRIPMGMSVIAGVLGAAVVAVVAVTLFRPSSSTPAVPAKKKARVAVAAKPAAPVAEAKVPAPDAALSVLVEKPVRQAPAAEAAALPVVAARPETPRRFGATAPRVESVRPARGERVSVMPGKSVDFTARAVDADPDDAVGYEWFLNGKKVSQRPSWRFVAKPALSARVQRVELQVSDTTGRKAPRLSWEVQIVTPMTEDNVRDWLARLGSAFERNDVTTLRLYGIVRTNAEAESMRARLAGYKGARVAIGNELIKLSGRFATAGVDLAWIAKGGKILAAERRTYELEKQAGGLVALRGR
jgi:serine/threonine-protein kinase